MIQNAEKLQNDFFDHLFKAIEKEMECGKLEPADIEDPAQLELLRLWNCRKAEIMKYKLATLVAWPQEFIALLLKR
jgi:hypothetical protein